MLSRNRKFQLERVAFFLIWSLSRTDSKPMSKWEGISVFLFESRIRICSGERVGVGSWSRKSQKYAGLGVEIIQGWKSESQVGVK